jgi:hypothetical protein
MRGSSSLCTILEALVFDLGCQAKRAFSKKKLRTHCSISHFRTKAMWWAGTSNRRAWDASCVFTFTKPLRGVFTYTSIPSIVHGSTSYGVKSLLGSIEIYCYTWKGEVRLVATMLSPIALRYSFARPLIDITRDNFVSWKTSLEMLLVFSTCRLQHYIISIYKHFSIDKS